MKSGQRPLNEGEELVKCDYEFAVPFQEVSFCGLVSLLVMVYLPLLPLFY